MEILRVENLCKQLKTPITSILIMLDNILDDTEMPKDIRKEFIKDIKREIINIKFLVESILKLSKIDSNTINFIKKYNITTIDKPSIEDIMLLYVKGEK